jgi:hypothetical protein
MLIFKIRSSAEEEEKGKLTSLPIVYSTTLKFCQVIMYNIK